MERPVGTTAMLAALLTAALASWPGGAATAQENPTIEEVLSGVVGLAATVPADARTAEGLGTERRGHGVVIDSSGLVLTIGYLILEAESVSLTMADGTVVPAEIVGYDHDSGFGLVRAAEEVDARPLPMADSAEVAPGDEVVVAGSGGPDTLIAARIVSRRTYTGYWEYLLENAIFTMPAYPSFGGAALIDKQGRLVGIGSLYVQDAGQPDTFSPGNMFVPVEALQPVLADLMTAGRPDGPNHPWLGLFTTPAARGLGVTQVARDGPAATAGIREGSLVVGLDGMPIRDQEDFYRRVWAKGEPGVTVRLMLIGPDGEPGEVEVVTGDRYDWLRLNPAN